ncbi:MAG TPA: restriction endonuclease subunit S [Azonexus sp.]|nr:restriction endonuclease subunit S [Azonexus sp.]
MSVAEFSRIPIGELVASGEAELKTGPFGTQLKASDYTENGTPVINVRNIGFGSIKVDKLEFIAPSTRDRLSSHVLKNGDIVFGRKGAVERHVFIRQEQNGWFQGSDCLRLRFASQRVEPLFASYYFLTSEHQRWMMNQCSHGATMASLNQGILERIELPLPPLPVQQRIAGILSAYDELIENSQRRIKILESMARALYREWFVHFRFPGHEHHPRVASPLGEIPQGWEVKTVADAFVISGGGTPSRKEDEFWEGGTIQWYSPSDLTGAGTMFMDDSNDHITERGLAQSSARMFPARSVMLTSRATIGAIAINTHPACTNQGFITCLPNDHVPLFFLFHWLTENVPTFQRMASGATFKEISRGVFKTIEFLEPPDDLVGRFEAIAAPMAEQVLSLQRQIQNLRRTRDLLLPRLLSGQVALDIEDPGP